MSVLENRDLQRLANAKLAYVQPAKLLGLDEDFLLHQSATEQALYIRSLRRATKQVELAGIMLTLALAYREEFPVKSARDLALALNSMDNCYWPLAFIGQVIAMGMYVEMGAIDDTLSLTYEHYKRIGLLFRDEHASRLAEFGLTPQKMIHSVARLGYSPDYVRKLSKTLRDIMAITGSAADKSDVVKQYLGNLTNKILSGEFDRREPE